METKSTLLQVLRGALLLLIVVPLALALWTFAGAFNKSVERHIDHTTVSALTQAAREINLLVQTAENAVELQNDVIKKSAIDFASEESDTALREFLKANVFNLGQLENIGLVKLADRHFFMSTINDEGLLMTREVTVDENDQRWQRDWIEKPTVMGSSREESASWYVSDYKVEYRPWFVVAMRQDASVDFELKWTTPYVFAHSGEVGVSCAKAINPPGTGYREAFAIAFADISLKRISDMLATFDVGAAGHMMLVDEADRVIASSQPQFREYLVQTGALPMATMLGQNYLDMGIWTDLKNAVSEASADGTSDLLHYRYQSTDYVVRSLSMADAGVTALNGRLWVFVPQESLLEDFDTARNVVYLIAGAALLLGIVIIVLMGRREKSA